MRFILTSGQCSDDTQTEALIDEFDTNANFADKGYDADYIVKKIQRIKIQAVIPPKSKLLVKNHMIQCFKRKEAL